MEVVGFESLPTGARQDEGSSQGGCCSAFALWDNTPYSVWTEFRATRAEEGQGRCRLALKNFLILAPPPLLVQATLGLSLQDVLGRVAIIGGLSRFNRQGGVDRGETSPTPPRTAFTGTT